MVRIAGVLFDLDDTLYGQAAWLDQAWRRVADLAGEQGVDSVRLLNALRAVAAEGSDKGRIIDRALERVGCGDGLVPVGPLVEAVRTLDAPVLSPYPGVKAGLARLRERVRVGLVTDGDPAIQLGKLEALGLSEAFDTVVLSDEMGREMRKPHPAPFAAALDNLGVSAADAVFVGDRPDKDVAGAQAAGMRVIRVRTGEYRKVEADAPPWHDVPHAVAAMALLETELGPRSQVAAGTIDGGGE